MTILPKKHKPPPDPKGQDRGVPDPEEPEPEGEPGIERPGNGQDEVQGQVSNLLNTRIDFNIIHNHQARTEDKKLNCWAFSFSLRSKTCGKLTYLLLRHK